MPLDTTCDGCHAQYMESMFRNTESLISGVCSRLNAASERDGRTALRLALDVPRWVDDMLGLRPFANDEAALRAIFTAADPLTLAEIDGALDKHPRIGDRPSGDDAHSEQARGEQSGVDLTQDEVAHRLRAGNIAYEQRFGRVFLIRAAGRDASEILAALDERIGNDAESELRVVERELREIAALRLDRVLSNA